MAVRGAFPGNLRAVLTSASTKALTSKAVRVQNKARRLCKVDTGTLRRSISFVIEGASPNDMVAKVGSNVEYALDVEQGTGIYGPHKARVVPVSSRVLVFPGKGGTVFATSVAGRRATPYLAPALDA